MRLAAADGVVALLDQSLSSQRIIRASAKLVIPILAQYQDSLHTQVELCSIMALGMV